MIAVAVLCLKDGRWVIYYRDFRPDGKPYLKREYFGRGPQAEAAARARNKELCNIRESKRKQAYDGPFFAELAASYSSVKQFSDNSLALLKIRLASNLLPHFGHMPAVGIGDADLDSYIAKRREQGVKWATIRRELTDLKAILNFAVNRRPPMILFNPVAKYKMPREDLDVIPPPTADELSGILKVASPHLVRAITLAAHIGCRPGGETLRITWDDVNFSTNTITVTSARKGGIAKRSVFIHPNLLTKLELWREQDRQEKIKTKHIIHYRNKPVERLKNSWWGALDRAGIRPWLKKKKLAKFKIRKGERRRLRMYDLRHLFVTMALDSGSDAGTVAAIVGSSPNTIMRHYRHVSIAAQRKTIMQVDPLNPKK